MGEKPLDGRTVVVTGASAGLGAAAARRLSALGATVAVVGRSPVKTAAVADSIGADPYTVDFGRLADVRALAATLASRYPTIDILANNAGSQFRQRTVSEDGHEMTLQVNHLAPFLLTNLLLDNITRSDDPRVITTASAAHGHGHIDLADPNGAGKRYNSLRRYAMAKLGNVLFSGELGRRAPVSAVCFHPGPVASDFFRDSRGTRFLVGSPLGRLVLKSADQGAAPLVHLATVTDIRALNGAYFDKSRRRTPKGRQAGDPELARRFWARSAALVGL
jgi:NAD(P)-dependent dehydrogenase (short-subunit alcohol dehydrogenase family)